MNNHKGKMENNKMLGFLGFYRFDKMTIFFIKYLEMFIKIF